MPNAMVRNGSKAAVLGAPSADRARPYSAATACPIMRA